jgi:hypothetical protein
MADRRWAPSPGHLGVSRVNLDFYFKTNAGSNPSPVASYHEGAVSTNVYAATGKYTLTMSARDTYGAVIFATAEMEDGASDGAYATIGQFSSEGTSTALSFVVSTFNAGGTLTQYASRRVWICMVCLNSTVPDAVGYG